MTTKKIEDLEPISSEDLDENDLLMVSDKTIIENNYISKKLTLATLAQYVNGSGGGTIVSNFGGYEIYDTSEEGDGTCRSQAELTAYQNDNSRNLLFDLPMYASSGVPYANFVV